MVKGCEDVGFMEIAGNLIIPLKNVYTPFI
jgi:hypothetical protein